MQAKAGDVSVCGFQQVQVLGAQGQSWHIDPDPGLVAVDQELRLWAWESRLRCNGTVQEDLPSATGERSVL